MNTREELCYAVSCSIRLHDFIRSNAGETADWPIQITSADRRKLEQLDALLREFRIAVEALTPPPLALK